MQRRFSFDFTIQFRRKRKIWLQLTGSTHKGHDCFYRLVTDSSTDYKPNLKWVWVEMGSALRGDFSKSTTFGVKRRSPILLTTLRTLHPITFGGADPDCFYYSHKLYILINDFDSAIFSDHFMHQLWFNWANTPRVIALQSSHIFKCSRRSPGWFLALNNGLGGWPEWRDGQSGREMEYFGIFNIHIMQYKKSGPW